MRCWINDKFYNLHNHRTIYLDKALTIDWYVGIIELLEFRKMYEVEEKNIVNLVSAYLKKFEKNQNTLVGKLWKHYEF